MDQKIEFHSFNTKVNRQYTVFLYGLPKVEISDIDTELKSYNLVPTSITEVNTKFSSPDNSVYKVQFSRNNFNPNSLKNVKTICSVIISWKKYKPKKNNNPTQCWNCLMYGHGGDHCHRQAACMICANQHHTSECPLNNKDKRPAVFTCFNCKKHGKERSDHSANDINCPLRAMYLQMRANASSKNINVKKNTQSNTLNFNHQSTNNRVINNNVFNSKVSYADCLKTNNNLFNINDLFDIFMTTLEDLKKCTNKIQQIQVVMSMVKYAYEL